MKKFLIIAVMSCAVLFFGCGEDNPVSSNKPSLEKCDNIESGFYYFQPEMEYIFTTYGYKNNQFNSKFNSNVLDFGIDSLKITLINYSTNDEIVLYENYNFKTLTQEVSNGYYSERKIGENFILDNQEFYFNLEFNIEKYFNVYGNVTYNNDLYFYIKSYTSNNGEYEIMQKYFGSEEDYYNYKLRIYYNMKSCKR